MPGSAVMISACGRAALTLRQIAALFGTSKSTAARIIDDLAPELALRPRKRFAPEAVLIVDGRPVPTRDHALAAKSRNHGYPTNHQVVIDAGTQMVVVVGSPLPGNHNDCAAYAEIPGRPRTGNDDVTCAHARPRLRGGVRRSGPRCGS